MADKIQVDRRQSFGKGASRQLRREGRTPAVVYGHGSEPVHISFDSHEIFLATKGQANPILTIALEGKEQLVLVKELQRNPLTRIIEHLDLLRVKQGEKVDVEVPVEVTGESFSGTIHTVELMHVLVKAPATAIPESIVVDVEGRHEVQVAHVVAAEVHVHEARDGVGGLGVTVVGDALDEGGGAVSDADDPDTDGAHGAPCRWV